MKIGKSLLDTNAIVYYLNEDRDAQSKIDTYAELFVPIIVVGELLFGAVNSAQAMHNLERINDFMKRAIALNCDLETAQLYSEVRLHCKKLGRPIPDHDIWIAAVSLQYDLPIITRDKHFEVVPGLQVRTW